MQSERVQDNVIEIRTHQTILAERKDDGLGKDALRTYRRNHRKSQAKKLAREIYADLPILAVTAAMVVGFMYFTVWATMSLFHIVVSM